MLRNVVAHANLNWRTPTEVAFGITPDISPFLNFHFYERIFFLDDVEGSFSDTTKSLGYWCGPTVHTGDAMTYLIMTSDTNQLIAHSVIRTENDKISPNKRVLYNKDDTTSSKNRLSLTKLRLQLYSLYDCISSKDKKSLPNVDPMDLIGKSYISDSNGLKQKATITNVDLEEESVALHYDSNN